MALSSLDPEDDVPGLRHRSALQRAGVRTDIIDALPDGYLAGLGLRLLHAEQRLRTALERVSQQAGYSGQSIGGGQEYVDSNTMGGIAVVILEAELRGLRVGIEAAASGWVG